MTPYHSAIWKEKDDTFFLHGACDVFALALNEHFDYSLISLATKDPKAAPHVYCRFDDNRSVDVVGIEFEYKALTELGWSGSNYYPTEVSRKELEVRFTDADTDFIAKARKRAQALIVKFKNYYSGQILKAVPGMSRMSCASPQEIQRIFKC